MRSTRAALLCCALAGLALGPACRSSDSAPAPAGSAAAAPLPAPERPAELVGVGSLAPASSFWPQLREALHPRDPSLPRSWGAALCAAAGLPITAAELFEDDRGSKLALARSESGASELVWAVPVRAVDRLLVVASSGRDARFDRVPEGRLELLRPRHPPAGRAPALGVSGNFLLLSTSEHALRLAGPWLVDPSTPALELGPSEWLRLELPADLRLAATDARAAPLLGLLGELPLGALPSVGELVGSTRPTLSVSGHALGWTLRLSGASASRPSEGASSGVREALLELPAELSAAVVVHADEAARLEQARHARAALESLASARGLEPFTELEALERLAEARGALGWVGYELSPVGPLAYGRLELRDPAAALAALDALFGVRKATARAPVRARRRQEPSPADSARASRLMRKTVLERVGEVYELRLRPADTPAPPTRLYARIEAGNLWVGVGGDAAQALERVRRADPPRLAGLAWPSSAVRLLPPDAQAAGFVELASEERTSTGLATTARPLLFAVDGPANGRSLTAILPPETLAGLVAAWRR